MAALTAAVRPFADGVPRRAVAFPSDANEQESGKKRLRVGVVPARNLSACLTKMTCNRSSIVTAAGKMSSQELLQKRLASERDAFRGVLKKAELISQRGERKGGAPAAGKDWFLGSNQRPKPIEEDSNAPSVKRRKIPTPVEQKQKQAPPQMSPEESKDDKVAEESKDDKLAEGSKGKQEEEYADISGGLSLSNGDSDTKVVQQSTEARKVQEAQRAAPKAAVDMRALLHRANLRRQLLEMERAALPDQSMSIDPRELQRLAILGIAECGHPSLMRQLRLVLKVDA